MSAFHPIPYLPSGPRPAADIRRLLAERPTAIGLAVPGMPMGSPGMEQGDAAVAGYEKYRTFIDNGQWTEVTMTK